MSEVQIHHLVGGFSRTEGPGFVTPVFQTRSSNYLAIQDIRKTDEIGGFLSVEGVGLSKAEFFNFGLSRRLGLKAYYAYRKIDGSLKINTRGRLKRDLISEYDSLRDRPFLKRTIARFIGDEDRLQSANAESKRLLREERGPAHTNARVLEGIEVERLILDRREYPLLIENLQRGLNTVLVGRNGTGKTHLLRGALIALSEGGHDVHWVDSFNDAATQDRLRSFVNKSWDRDESESNPAIVFIDDVDVALTRNSELSSILRSAHSPVCFAASSSSSSIPSDGKLQEGLDFSVIQIAPLSANEIARFLKRASLDSSFWKDEPSLLQIEELLEGFSFREVLTIVSDLVQSEGNLQRQVRRAVEVMMERALERAFSSVVESSELQLKDTVVATLDAIARSRSRGVSIDEISSQIAASKLGYTGDTTGAIETAIDRLQRNGVIVSDGAQSFSFAHRMIKDQWISKRPRVSHQQQLSMNLSTD